MSSIEGYYTFILPPVFHVTYVEEYIYLIFEFEYILNKLYVVTYITQYASKLWNLEFSFAVIK